MEYRDKKVIVVGASAGMGAEIVRQLTRQGARVAALARRDERLAALKTEMPHLLVFRHDVTEYDAVPELFAEVTKALEGFDAIFYCAGVMPSVGFHEYDFAKDRSMIETNLLGAIAWLNQAAIRCENTKRGNIVAIGSVAGERGRSGQPVYNTSKAALKTYMEALRNRLSRHGVKVVLVKPGPTETDMTSALGLKGMMPVQDAARKIIAVSHRDGEHFLKFSHKMIFTIIRAFPSGIFKKLKV